jgi:hypothetical protein
VINPTSRWAPGLLPGIMLGACIAMSAHAADSATGSLNYKGRSVDLKYAWLVTGPSDMEPGKVVRRLILAGTDIGAKLQACKTFSCTDGEVTEGMTADFTGGPRINYWVAMNGQKIQYSGTATPDAFTARADAPGRLAGRLAIDDVAAGGPKLSAEFDVSMLKEFKVAR